jgi:FAD/FMN-containing dehydrogenase
MHAAGGVVSTTGIAGLALGGGLGHLTRRAGLTCDNLLSAGVVTADGQLVMASEKENADLFWALRGGGGNFGVVTSFEFRLHPIRTVYAGPVLWPPDQAVEAMRFYREFMKEAPQELNALFAFIVVPPEPPFPQHLHNRPMSGVVICYSGDPQKGPEVTKSLRTFGSPALDATGQLPFPMLQKAFDAVSPPGLQNYWKTDFFSELNDDAIEAHTAFGKDVPNIFSGSIIFPIDGAAHNARNEDTAWGFRDANFSNVIYAAYEDPAKTPEMIQWVRDYWAAVHPHSTGGTYVNFAMDEGEEHVNACYGRNLTRLAKIKGLYDPGNLFRMNQNIKPGRP